MKLQHLDLFSGIGGFSLGLEATGGFETKAFCDIEKYPRQVLQKHWPHVKQYEDIKELNYERLKADGIDSIDIITGGYPCQPFSIAGRKKGEEDPRHLWPEYFRLIKELRPTWVIGENVSGHIKLGLDTVIQDLESEDYAVRPFSISASSIGANHQRERIWVVAYSECNDNFNEEQRVNGEEKEIPGERGENDSSPRELGRANTIRKTNNGDVADTKGFGSDGGEIREHSEKRNTKREVGGVSSQVANTDSEGLERQWKSRNQFGSQFTAAESGEVRQGEMGQGWWSVEPNVGRVAHGIPRRVDRLKSLGNSLVPQIPYYIGQSILKAMADTNSE